jgi:UDP-N-acetylglucosamine 2-epimerase (non-hydrolysing)
MTSPKDASPTVINNPISPSVASTARPRILVIFGTRPEAIKLCPLVLAFRGSEFRELVDVVVCVTAQHRQMLDQVLDAFGVHPDIDLNLMQTSQSLPGLTARLMAALEPVMTEVQPAMVVVQGDTTTTFCGALSAFYAGVPVAHVEAGLRTFDLQSPFPEEMNRVLTSSLTTLHFAATKRAASNLEAQGIAAESISITGNTGIDAVLWVRDGLTAGRLVVAPLPLDTARKLVLVTAHRRESFGAGFERICDAIAAIASRDDVQVVWPVHLNPEVRRTVFSRLENHPNILFLEPLDYLPFVDLMQKASILITDSGGIQEEAPSLGKPVLVLRDKTERPEAMEAGTAKLVGTNTEDIVREANRLLDDEVEYGRMARLHNPYGDGQACERIVKSILAFLDQLLTNQSELTEKGT